MLTYENYFMIDGLAIDILCEKFQTVNQKIFNNIYPLHPHKNII